MAMGGDSKFHLVVAGGLFALGGVTAAVADFGSARLNAPITEIPAGVARRGDVNERLQVLDERTRQLDQRADGANVLRNPDTGAVAHVAALVCGISPPVALPATANIPGAGPVTGYRAVKRICEETCGAATARVCTSNDVILSVQLGRVPVDGGGIPMTTSGLVSGGTSWSGRGPDCRGWLGDTAPPVPAGEAGRFPSANRALFAQGNVEIVDFYACDGTLGVVCCN